MEINTNSIKKNVKYETLDELLSHNHLEIVRRCLYNAILIIKLDKAVSKDREIELIFGLEKEILNIFNGKKWLG